jgi:DNA-binding transcriptional MerR regulator
MGSKGYAIEEVCERLGVTPRTLHYYEEIGLIDGVPRTEGGHRHYDDRIVERIELVLKLKDLLGFTLQEIRAVVDLESRLEQLKTVYRQQLLPSDKRQTLDEAAPILEQLIERMTAKIDKLQSLRESFEQRLNRVNTIRNEVD